MNHLLNIQTLDQMTICALIARAIEFKNKSEYPCYKFHTLANLFYENSTRTRISFELAAQRLSIPTIHWTQELSSEHKGECIEDTIRTLIAMGIDLFVIRHSQEDVQKQICERIQHPNVHFINAGDGKNEHPSQALLDLMTISESKPHLEKLNIAIIGNIKHSRVANSLQKIFAKVGINTLRLIAPKIWQPLAPSFGEVTDSLKAGLEDADVVICLRIQHERLANNEQFSLVDYRAHYALTSKTLQYAKPSALIMHPGPINRGVEIDDVIADGKQSLILQQVQNGVFMRMSILEKLVRAAK